MDQPIRKSVLIVTNNFIPYVGSIGSAIRVVTLCSYLENEGFDVFVLANEGDFTGYFGYEFIFERIHVEYVRSKDSAISDWLMGNTLLLSQGLLPETRAKRFHFMAMKAEKIILQHNITNVIVSSPPHNSQLISLFLKLKLRERINLIVDYRDGWFTNNHYRKRSVFGRIFSERKEIKILECCDHFTYVSDPIIKNILNRYRVDKLKDKATLVMNGYSETVPPQAAFSDSSNVIKIGYFGSLDDSENSFRNISAIIEALRNAPELQNRVQFHLYGDIKLVNTSLEGVTNIQVNKSLTHSEALKRMCQMDYLLIIHSDPATSEEVITGKFFEYVSVKKPILNITPPVMEANRLVLNNKIGQVIDITSSKAIVDGLSRLNKMSDCYQNLDISVFSRERQYKKLLSFLV